MGEREATLMAGLAGAAVIALCLFTPSCRAQSATQSWKGLPGALRERYVALAVMAAEEGGAASGRRLLLAEALRSAQSAAEVAQGLRELVTMGFELGNGEELLRGVCLDLERPELAELRRTALPPTLELTELTLRDGLKIVGRSGSIRERYPELSEAEAGGQIFFEPNLGVPGLGNWTLVKSEVLTSQTVAHPLPKALLVEAEEEHITDDGDLAITGLWHRVPGVASRETVPLRPLRITSGGTLFVNDALAIQCLLPTHRYPGLAKARDLPSDFVTDVGWTESNSPKRVAHHGALERFVEPLLDRFPDAESFDLLNVDEHRVRELLARDDLITDDAEESLLRIRFVLRYGSDVPPLALSNPKEFRDREHAVLEALSSGVINNALASWSDVATAAAIVRHGSRFSPRPKDGLADGVWTQFPKDYSPWQRWPLLVVLHGQYSRPDYDFEVWRDLAERAGMVLVCPLFGSPAGAPRTPDDDNRVLDVIRRMVLNHDIDSDRVYLTGISMGGAKTWSLASQYGDRFAAAAPEIHGPIWKVRVRGREKPDYFLLPNLAHLPMSILEGRFDGLNTVNSREAAAALQNLGAPVNYFEADLIGHERMAWRYEHLLTWFSQQRRPTIPTKISHRAIHPWSGSHAWLEIRSVARPTAWNQRDGRFAYADLVGVAGQIEGSSITLDVTRGQPREVQLLYAKEVMGAGPLTVRYGRRKRTWTPKPSVRVLLEQVIATGDRSRLYTDRMAIMLEPKR